MGRQRKLELWSREGIAADSGVKCLFVGISATINMQCERMHNLNRITLCTMPRVKQPCSAIRVIKRKRSGSHHDVFYKEQELQGCRAITMPISAKIDWHPWKRMQCASFLLKQIFTKSHQLICYSTNDSRYETWEITHYCLGAILF